MQGSSRTHGVPFWVAIRIDGLGGDDPVGGSGLRGLADRVEALGGRLSVTSPVGVGTTVTAQLEFVP